MKKPKPKKGKYIGKTKATEKGGRRATASAPVSGKTKSPKKILKSGDKADRKGKPKPSAMKSRKALDEKAFEKKYGNKAI